jgi:hypothetical protein
MLRHDRGSGRYGRWERSRVQLESEIAQLQVEKNRLERVLREPWRMLLMPCSDVDGVVDEHRRDDAHGRGEAAGVGDAEGADAESDTPQFGR